MYDNIGGKIKGLAMVTFMLEMIAAIIIGLIIIIQGIDYEENMIPIGFLIMVVGPLVAWISSWLLYGFGELIAKTCEIERNTRGGERKSEAQAKLDSDRISKIERLRSQGLITEEEYKKAISNDK